MIAIKPRVAVLCVLAVACCASYATAAEIRIGVIVPLTGLLANQGVDVKEGINVFQKLHGTEVAGNEVHVLYRDTGGVAPAAAKRDAQDMLIQDKVNILGGFVLSPNAISVAPLATQFKVPMVIMAAAATSSITNDSPYIVRTSATMPQDAAAIAQWAYQHDRVRTAYVLVEDYAPGFDWQKQFTKTFTSLGGKVVGSVRVPMSTVDYSPYLQRVRNAKPDALFVFEGGGQPAVSLMKSIERTQFKQSGIKVLGSGYTTDESVLQSEGAAALGTITALHYSAAHHSEENQRFLRTYRELYPNAAPPDYLVVAAYDGMHLIYEVLSEARGNADAQAFVAKAKGMKWESPRGRVEIDPETRDIIQNEYIRKVERVDEKLQNVEFFVYKAVKDPGKTPDNKFEYAGSGPVTH